MEKEIRLSWIIGNMFLVFTFIMTYFMFINLEESFMINLLPMIMISLILLFGISFHDELLYED